MWTKLVVAFLCSLLVLSACGKASPQPAPPASANAPVPAGSGSVRGVPPDTGAPIERDAVYSGTAAFHTITRLSLKYGDGESQLGYQFWSEGDGWYKVPGSVVTDGRGEIYIDDPVHSRVQVYSMSGEHVRTIPTAASRLGADPSGRVYGIVSGGLGVLGGDSATQLRPYHFISPVALRVSPDGTVVVKDSASETKSSARVIVFGVDGSVEELEDSGMPLNAVDGSTVELWPPDRGQPTWEVRIESSGKAATSWRYVPQPPDSKSVLWRFELICLDKLDRAYFHRTTGPDPGAAGPKGLSEFIDIMNIKTGHVVSIPLAPRGPVAAPGLGDGLFIDSSGAIYQLLETQSSVKVLEYVWTSEDQLPTGGVPSADEVAAGAGVGRIEISSPHLGAVRISDANLETTLNQGWQKKEPITWYDPGRSAKGISVTQQLPDGQTRTAWFQPAIMWVDGHPFGGEDIAAVWRGVSARIITSPALEATPRTADSIVLVAAGVPSRPSITLNPEQRARLQAILAGADSFQQRPPHLQGTNFASPTRTANSPCS